MDLQLKRSSAGILGDAEEAVLYHMNAVYKVSDRSCSVDTC